MSGGRLRTEIWVMAHVRRCSGEGVPAMVVRRGDPDSGMVALKISTLDGLARVYTLTRDMEGELVWLPALKGEAAAEREADDYLQRQMDRDPDLWVVEIEDRQGRLWFEGKVL